MPWAVHNGLDVIKGLDWENKGLNANDYSLTRSVYFLKPIKAEIPQSNDMNKEYQWKEIVEMFRE